MATALLCAASWISTVIGASANGSLNALLTLSRCSLRTPFQRQEQIKVLRNAASP